MRLRLALVVGGHALERRASTCSTNSGGERGAARPSRPITQPASSAQSATVVVKSSERSSRCSIVPYGRSERSISQAASGSIEDRRELVALAELPGGAVAVGARVELGRHAEVALAPRREAHVAAHAVEAERAHVVAVVVAADHVPLPAHEVEAVRVDRAQRLLVGRDRPVAEDDGALLRDRGLELLQPDRDLGGEAAPEQAHGDLGRHVVGRVRAAECEVLEREPQRLRIGELAVEQVHGGRERRELRVVRGRAAAGSSAPAAACRAPRR